MAETLRLLMEWAVINKSEIALVLAMVIVLIVAELVSFRNRKL